MRSKSKIKSIKKNLWASYISILVLMILPTIYSISITQYHAKQYNQIIQNVTTANKINRIIKQDISNEAWEIVAGKKKWEDGQQYKILSSIESGIADILEDVNIEDSRQKLEVANRAERTLKKYVDLLGSQVKNSQPVSEQEKTLDEIRGCSSLLNDILQDFIVAEIETLSKTSSSIRRTSILLLIIQITIILVATALTVFSVYTVSVKIRKPIQSMEILSNKIAGGDLTARVENPNVEELQNLCDNLNLMAVKINELIKANVREQQNLRKEEMKTLQAQITPHFLYNTFDTIIWLAEQEEISKVVKLTKAFSNFLRISLSRGHEWISVEHELDHVRNYLTIQKIRYTDILNYDFEINEELLNFKMIKLTLQPLVENAIYHGIKNKRGRGHLVVKADFADEKKDSIRFSVYDDGAGFTEERLNEVKRELESGSDNAETLSSVYGLYNVNKKLKLYYETKTNGLEIKSEHGKGSTVSFLIPCTGGECNV